MASNKIDRFTRDARHVLVLAQEEALRLNHAWIGPEHLLLGLARTHSPLLDDVFGTLDMAQTQIIQAVEERVSRGATPPGREAKLSFNRNW